MKQYTHACMHADTPTHMHTHAHAHIRTHTYTHTYTHTHTHTHIHTHTHTHTHTYTTWFSLSIVSTIEGCTGDGVEQGKGEVHNVSAGGTTLSFSASCDSAGGVAGGSAVDN